MSASATDDSIEARRGPAFGRAIPLTIILFLAGIVNANSDDIFGTRAQIPPNPAASLQSGAITDYCRQEAIRLPVVLFDAIERALCESPKTRSAWAAIKAAAAGLGMSKSAYLPTLEGSVKYAYQHNETQVSDAPELQSNFAKPVNEESLALGWVLYDFGARAASLDNSHALLLSAQANHDATVQSIFASTAKDYFGAQAANANVQSKRRIEESAHDNLVAATARVTKGVAPLTDQLQ